MELKRKIPERKQRAFPKLTHTQASSSTGEAIRRN